MVIMSSPLMHNYHHHHHHHHQTHLANWSHGSDYHPLIWSTANNLLIQLRDDQLNIDQKMPQSLEMPTTTTTMSIFYGDAFSNHSSLTTSKTESFTTTVSASSSLPSKDALSLSAILTLDTILTLILPYSIIFILSIVGNLLVIITLTLDHSMRSVTNIFLLNLAISDLLLGVFCMPFTLVGVLLRRFIFGAFVCHMISYFQAVSVAVSVWTLVSMSIERYYAICHPFRSRESRQTKKHAYRILAMVWTLAFITMSPTAIVSKLQQTNQTGHYKCREAWPSFLHKQVFTLFLDFILLIIPLIIMILTYGSIALTLRHSVSGKQQINCDINHQNQQQKQVGPTKHLQMSITMTKNKSPNYSYKTTSFNQHDNCNLTDSIETVNNINNNNEIIRCQKFRSNQNGDHNNHSYNKHSNHFKIGQHITETNLSPTTTTLLNRSSSNHHHVQSPIINNGLLSPELSGSCGSLQSTTNKTILRVANTSYNSYHGTSRQRRIITMLFVVVIEFFICWSPIFLLDTMALYRPELVYGTSQKVSNWIGIDIISVCHLLCFCSTCNNPITYCFMNKRFRDHFSSLFRCRTAIPVNMNNPSSIQQPNEIKV
uniref:Gastrin/cholecystokinin type B receptor-like n=1 Tax=Dermatophagoides pteronyssinus TaxID=6956 RepID=A0A6P6XZP8_DERPT|nr:gastrin/cholecystokinin type B receptor-like [Dermatophagoides pteronyssinus]